MEQAATLFGPHPAHFTPEQVTAACQAASPLTQAWIARMEKHLPTLVTASLASGTAQNATEALAHIVATAEGSPAPTRINWGDLKQETSLTAAVTSLERVLSPVDRARIISHRNLGCFGHALVPQVMQHAYPGLHQPSPAAPPYQLCLFEMDEQLKLFSDDELNLDARSVFPDAFTAERRLSKRHLKRIQLIWESARLALAQAKRWDTQLRTAQHYVSELRSVLRPVYGQAIDRIRPVEPYGFYLELITLMTWASCLLHAENQEAARILFTEINVVDPRNGMGLGRIDAIEVIAISGKPPSKSQRRILRHLASRRYHSVQHLVRELMGKLGTELTLEIIDWKMAVGDHPSPQGIIQAKSVRNRPLSKHAKQVQCYLSFSRFDTRIIGPNWQTELFATPGLEEVCGSIVYCLPGELPIVHNLEHNPQEDTQRFDHEVFSHLGKAQTLAAMRTITQHVTGELRRQLKPPKKQKRPRATVPVLDL